MQSAIYEIIPDEKGPFPKSLISYPIDTHILDLFSAARQANNRLAFLYYYQVLEYASFYFIEENVRLSISKVLRRPDLISSTDSCLALIMDAITESKQSDEHKLSAVIQRSGDPSRIWAVIEKYIEYFSEPHVFDGDFELPAFVKKEWTDKDFSTAWIPKLPDSLRKIRNALVHARERRMGNAIIPTKANSQRLSPWLKVIEEVACEVALYRNA